MLLLLHNKQHIAAAPTCQLTHADGNLSIPAYAPSTQATPGPAPRSHDSASWRQSSAPG